MTDEKIETTDGFGIWITGHDAYPVATFRYEEHAEEWARENYFGQWLMKPIKFQLIAFCTEEEYAQAQEDAVEIVKFFNPLPSAENQGSQE